MNLQLALKMVVVDFKIIIVGGCFKCHFKRFHAATYENIRTFDLRMIAFIGYSKGMKKITVILILTVMALCGCRIQDQRELVVKVPQMKAERDVAKIRNSLLPLRGVDLEHAQFDLAAQTVTLSFDSMVIANKNIEVAIAEAGYDANGVAAIKK